MKYINSNRFNTNPTGDNHSLYFNQKAIKKTFFAFIALLLLLLHAACQSDTGHISDKAAGDKVEAAAHNHREMQPMVTSLSLEQMKTIGLEFGTLQYKELAATFRANGMLTVPNNHKGHATSLYSGVIKSIPVQIGDYIRKGQVIATITNPQFIQLQEEYLTLNSKIILAEQELQRQNELNQENAGTLRNLQSATAELNTLKTRKASLTEQIKMMGINPATITNQSLRSVLSVTSPISGTVSKLYGKIGSYVDVSSPVAEIVDNSSLHLDLHVFERDLGLLKVGQIIHFTITNNPVNEYDAVIYSIGTAFENDSKTIPVHAAVKGNKAGLIDGMNITGVVSLDKATTQAVPDGAIVESEGKFFIFIQTDKEPEDHQHEGEDDGHGHGIATVEKKHLPTDMNFEKIEVVKGVSNMGYTALTLVKDIPADAKIVTKGAFFINARLTNAGEDGH
ncbi:MAG: efflux RND transporter periplasmic adaptor subunit [Saprospiraceae bacterium]|nr:MAG: RND family efflux transporter MFP subunit [Candidatus Parvibacillus calidus]MCC7150030.1 efflux RND transporter periplasmic adaptor subunit [Saprospiraceae bacterium]